MTAVVVLDRDATLVEVLRDEETGVLFTAFHPSHLRFLPGVVDGLRVLRDAGFALAVATNQPGPAKGQCSREAVTRTHAALQEMLLGEGIALARIEACLHHPEKTPHGEASLQGPCDCRKPAPGLVETILRETGADRARSWMVGDAATDVEAGKRAGLHTALVFAPGRCELCPWTTATPGAPKPDVVAPTLVEIAREILRRTGPLSA